MEKHNIDKLFSDKLAGHTPAFNPAHWSQMEGVIQAQGNSGSWLWWMIGAGLIVLTSVGLGSNHYLRASEGQTLQFESSSVSREAVTFHSEDKQEGQQNQVASFAQAAVSSETEADVLGAASQKVVQNDASNSNEPKSIASNNDAQRTKSDNNLGSNKQKAHKNAPNALASTSDEETKTTANDKNSREDVQSGIKGEHTAQPKPELTSDEKDDVADAAGHTSDVGTNDVKKETADWKNFTPVIPVINDTPVFSTSDNSSEPNLGFYKTGDRGSNKAGAGLRGLPILDPTGNFSNPLNDPEFITPEIGDVPLPDFYKAYKWALSASAGAYGSSKILKTDYEFLNPFIDKRNTEEQSSLTPSFGLELAYVPGRFSINSGFHLNSVSYEANYTPYESQVADSIVDNSFYEFTIWEESLIDSVWQDTSNNQGNGVWVIDTIYVTMIDSLLIQSFDTTFSTQLNEFPQKVVTTYSYFEVPIHVGYTVPLGDKSTHLGVYGGVSLTYMRATTGAYINQGLDELQAAQKKETAVGLDLIARLRLTQGIGYRTSIFVEGRYRQGLGSVSTSADYTEKHRLYGGAIGLSYKF